MLSEYTVNPSSGKLERIGGTGGSIAPASEIPNIIRIRSRRNDEKEGPNTNTLTFWFDAPTPANCWLQLARLGKSSNNRHKMNEFRWIDLGDANWPSLKVPQGVTEYTLTQQQLNALYVPPRVRGGSYTPWNLWTGWYNEQGRHNNSNQMFEGQTPSQGLHDQRRHSTVQFKFRLATWIPSVQPFKAGAEAPRILKIKKYIMSTDNVPMLNTRYDII